MRFFRNMGFGPKLIMAFLLVGLIPMAVVGYKSYTQAEAAIVAQATATLSAVGAIKKQQVEGLYQRLEVNAGLIAGLPTTVDAVQSLRTAFDSGGGVEGGRFVGYTNARFDAPASYKLAHDQYYAVFKRLMDTYGYYDIFLMDPDNGDVVFSVTKEGDFGTRTADIDSGLRDAWALTTAQRRAALSDIGHYAPSNGVAAQFITVPILAGKQVVGVLGIQVPIEWLNVVMTEHTGLGESGETYLVGADHTMRSESRFEEDTTLSKVIESEGVVEGLQGRSDVRLVEDYRGILVLSGFSKVAVRDVDWVLLAEIDDAEIRAPLDAIRNALALVAGIAAGIVVALALLFARSLRQPIRRIVEVLEKVADGDLSTGIDIHQGDEIGQMAKSVNRMVESLSATVRTVQSTSSNVASGSDQIARGNQSLSQQTQEQAASIEETSSIIEEMTATVQQNAANARGANEIAQKTSHTAQTGGDVVRKTVQSMSEVIASAKRIADIVDMVNEIAFQTNLLALNAAIEAARAGDQGKGFAVVAKEVRTLAGRSANAAKEIQDLINDSNAKIADANGFVSQSGEMLEEIIESVGGLATNMSEIAAASDEQSTGIEQVNRSVAQIEQVIQQNATLVEEASAAAENLAGEAVLLNDAIAAFRLTKSQGEQAQRPRGGEGRPAPERNAGYTSEARIPQDIPNVPADEQDELEDLFDDAPASTY